MSYKIFVINPGSTSTKLAYFEDENKLFETSVFHDAPFLASLGAVSSQIPHRLELIRKFIKDNNIDLTGVDAIVGRGGASMPCIGGTYEANDLLVQDNFNAVTGVDHPANLGLPLAVELQKEYGGRVFMVDSPKTDEFCDLARITGVAGIYRTSSTHALNLKGTVRMHCRKMGVKYEDGNYIVCHIDGGMTISAHDHGRMIDATNNAAGEGPFTPTRTGALPVSSVIDYYFDNEHKSKIGIADTDFRDSGEAVRAAREILTRNAGLTGHFGTSNADTIHEMVEAGDPKATRVWNAMIYNICKYIGEMAVVLSGKVDGIVCGGGLLRFDDLKQQITDRCGWIAPVSFYPGEVEHEAMAAGALRVLRGEEEPLIYTGKPVFEGFNN
ncbi:MAG: butyrate kinase [Mogibacterium sp.]|nr:butyrate kinase [Mogibacterium sp.]